MSQKIWGWGVFFFSAGGYIPLGIGGWQHPVEINVASYSLWLILTVMMVYSSRAQGFAGWRMPLAWMIGNASILLLACFVDGWTFNLGPAETIVLYGIIMVIGTWVTMGQVTGKWSPRILFLGSIIVDAMSFYPQLKQYLLPHEPPTRWLLIGWVMMLIGALVNVALVERLPLKLRLPTFRYEQLYEKTKSSLLIFEESALSLESSLLMIVTIMVMAS